MELPAENGLEESPNRGNWFRETLAKLDRFFATRSRNVILTICLFLALFVGALDVQGSTGLLIFYLLPIALAASYGGKRVGAVIAIYCAVAWYLAGAIANNFKDFNPVSLWSFGARLGIFLVLTQVIARLREAMRQQRELMQFIVHDLRSPISSAITGLLTLQQEGTNLNEFEAEMITLALVSNRRALTLVNSMLDMAKLESGSMPIRRTIVSLQKLVGDCFEQVALWANSEDIRLVLESRLDNASLDADLTSRVLVNLLSNALKYSPPGGVVKVSIDPVPNGALKFVVADQGPGIPPEYVSTIFDPFTQVKGTHGGTGLGLTFCRLAVQAQGGRIWVESEVGKGARMVFTIPIKAPITSDESSLPQEPRRESQALSG